VNPSNCLRDCQDANMLPLRLGLTIFLFAMIIPGALAADGQNYPNRVIRIVTTETGGGSDFNARMIAQGLTVSLGQPVIVDNRPGTLSTEAVARAVPDGYTLLFNGSTVWLLPFLRDNVPYDPVKDLSPVTLATRAPSILVVHPSLPVKTVKELIALAKARPGEINYAAGVIGAPPHIAGELFKARAGVNIVQVNYKGIGLAFNDVIGGQVQLMFPTAGSVMPHIRSGRLRALAVTTLEPSALVPGLPTVAASVPGYESTAPLAVFAPAKTPAALINRLNQEIVRVLNSTEVKGKFLNVGIEPVGSSPEELAVRIKSDMIILGKLIKDAGIRGD
jgi:tripartite-type tricarboxylate transporter receptor subunit TctC